MVPAVLVSVSLLSLTVWSPPTLMPLLALTSSVLPPETVTSPVSLSVFLMDTMPPASMSTNPLPVTVRMPVSTLPAALNVTVLCLAVADCSTVMVFRATLPSLVAPSATLVIMVAVPPFFTIRFLSEAFTLPSAVFSSQITPSTTMSPVRLVSPSLM